MKKSGLLLLSALTASAFTHATPAEACGGCFVPPSDVSVVTDHRMALSISTQETILWDQIRYSGDPREFAWVLPVKAGATLELANDEFFGALDAATQPTVYAPQNSNTVGCSLTGCASDNASDFASGSAGGNGVQVISQSVVGPYDQVTLRATVDGALITWLRANQFAIPSSIEPTIAAYVAESFDFIALKLRPECGQRSMKPVRVVTPGAVPTLPLRMVAAGVGPKVGITLYVISEGKYEPQNFPHVLIPDEKLRWDRYQNKSNYEPLSQDLMAQQNGKTWITEYADKPQIAISEGWQDPNRVLPASGATFTSSRFANVGLTSTYYSLCKAYRGRYNGNSSPFSPSGSSSGGVDVTPCPEPDAGIQGGRDAGGGVDSGLDAGIADAGDDDASDAGEDAGNPQGDDDDNQQTSSSSSSSSSSSGGIGSGNPYDDPETQCVYLDDLDRAVRGLHRADVWVTRLRATLPANALAEGDLLVQPSKLADGRADAETVSNVHWTPYYADDDLSDDDVKNNCAGSPRHYHRPYASGAALLIFGAAVAIALARRHRRPKK